MTYEILVAAIIGGLVVSGCIALCAFLLRQRLAEFVTKASSSMTEAARAAAKEGTETAVKQYEPLPIERIDGRLSGLLGLKWGDAAKLGRPMKLIDRLVLTLSPAEHPEVWANFEGRYYGINAPWQVERLQPDQPLSEALKIQLARYSNPSNSAVYVFFSKGQGDASAPYPESRRKAAMFWESLAARDDVGLPLAEVAVIEADEEAPNFTVFVGKKKVIGTDESRLVSVIYISDHVFTTKRGLPLWAFVCYDQLLNDELWNYCRRLEDKYSSKKIPAEAFVQRVLAEGAEVISPDGRLGA